MSPRRSRRYVGAEAVVAWWHCHQDVVTAIPVALGGEGSDTWSFHPGQCQHLSI